MHTEIVVVKRKVSDLRQGLVLLMTDSCHRVLLKQKENDRIRLTLLDVFCPGYQVTDKFFAPNDEVAVVKRSFRYAK